MKIKLTPSIVDSFSLLMDEKAEYMDDDSFIERLTSKYEPNANTAFGSFCHEIIHFPEHFNPNELYDYDGFSVMVTETQYDLLKRFSKSLPVGVFEQSMKKYYRIDGHEILMSGRSDHLSLFTIRDFKFVSQSRKYNDTFNLFQWKIYLSIFEMDRFVYDFFIKRKNDFGYQEMELTRYDNMENDIMNIIREMFNFFDVKGLWKYVELENQES